MQEALRLVAWSRVWSPLVPEAWRAEAWQQLALPGSWGAWEAEFWSSFHVGLPTPRVPLLLHAALGRDGGHAREDWMRAASHLGLRFGEAMLPPDHLGVAAEVLACAVQADEAVLVRELCSRYLRPWCEVARARLAACASPLAALPVRFEVELASAEQRAQNGT
jgi:hypothetical protein